MLGAVKVEHIPSSRRTKILEAFLQPGRWPRSLNISNGFWPMFEKRGSKKRRRNGGSHAYCFLGPGTGMSLLVKGSRP